MLGLVLGCDDDSEARQTLECLEIGDEKWDVTATGFDDWPAHLQGAGSAKSPPFWKCSMPPAQSERNRDEQSVSILK